MIWNADLRQEYETGSLFTMGSVLLRRYYCLSLSCDTMCIVRIMDVAYVDQLLRYKLIDPAGDPAIGLAIPRG